jgi:hypothetical protein
MKNIIVIAPSRSGHNYTAAMLQSWVKDYVFKFEGIVPSKYHRSLQTRLQSGRRVDPKGEVITFIQVRDYLNWAASWIKYNLNRGAAWNESRVNRVFQEWYEIVREAMGDTAIIQDKYILFYDQFVQSKSYREGVCFLIDGDYNEDRINHVPNGGMGSSFDLYKLQDNGNEMDFLNRWKFFITEHGEEYQSFLKVHKNILEFYMDKFDLTEGQSKLANEILR